MIARMMNLRIWLVVVLLGGGAGREAGAAEPTREEVLSLVTRQVRSWETGDETLFLATVHADIVFAYPGKRLDQAGALRVFQDWKRDFRDTRMTVFRTVIEGRHFAIEYTFGTTNNETGVRTAAGTVAIGEVQDGKLFVWKEYLDGRVSRMQGKGELPVQEESEPYPWPDTPESRRP